jgi:hypothetical protein
MYNFAFGMCPPFSAAISPANSTNVQAYATATIPTYIAGLLYVAAMLTSNAHKTKGHF